MPRITRVAEEFSVPVYSGAGFDGLKAKRATAARARTRSLPTVALQIGDLDTSGKEIYVAHAEDAIAWANHRGVVLPQHEGGLAAVNDHADDHADKPFLIFARLALTTQQANDHDLLDADGKAEVDGLPVHVLDTLIRDGINHLHVPARREALLQLEQQERERLPKLIREALAGATG